MGQITLQGVRKSFGPVNIIKDANLDIEDGSFVVFVGPSGCGKTTLLRLIAGLEDVTGGQILIDGKNVVDVPPAKRGLSMVFQSYALYPHMSVRGNIAFGLKMAGLPRPEIDRKVEAAAATLNLILAWNEAFWTLNLSTSNAAPLTTFIASYSSPEGLFWAKLSAASTLAIAPILVLGWFSQKQLVRGLTFGAVK